MQGKGASTVTSTVNTCPSRFAKSFDRGQHQVTCVAQRDIREAFGLWDHGCPAPTQHSRHYSRPVQTFREGGGTQHYNAPEHKRLPSNNKGDGAVPAQSLQPADMFAIGIAFLDTLSSKGYVQMPRQEGRDEKLALARASDFDLWTRYLGKNPTNFMSLSPDWQLALSLAKSLLHEDSEKRLTAHHALRHPFFSRDAQ